VRSPREVRVEPALPKAEEAACHRTVQQIRRTSSNRQNSFGLNTKSQTRFNLDAEPAPLPRLVRKSTRLALLAHDQELKVVRLVKQFKALIHIEFESCRNPADVDRTSSRIFHVVSHAFDDLTDVVGADLMSSQRSQLRGSLQEEARLRKEELASQGPCMLARSAKKPDQDAGNPKNEKLLTVEDLSRRQKEPLWEEVYHRLADELSDLARERLPQALELSGVPQLPSELIDKIYGNITSNDSLTKDDFINFMREYELFQRHEHALAFRRLDSDGNDMLDEAEIAELLRTLGIEPMRHVLREIISEVDVDGDCCMDLSEFEQVMTTLQARSGFTKQEFDELVDVFSRFDVDQSGDVDGQELDGVLEFLGFNFLPEQIAKVVHEVDLDGSGSINQREFMVCMRRFRELEIQRIKRIMIEVDEDQNGSMSSEELMEVFKRLGYDTTLLGVNDAATEAGVVLDHELDLSELWRVLSTFRHREGFTNGDLAEIQEAFRRYNADGVGEVNTMEVGKMLYWLGYSVPFEIQQMLVDKVDVSNKGNVDMYELKKLIRMLHGRSLAGVRTSFHNLCRDEHGIIGVREAIVLLKKNGCVAERPEPLYTPEDMTEDDQGNEGFRISGILAACQRSWDKSRRRLQANCGFQPQHVQEFREMFRYFDTDKNDSIDMKELGHMIEQAFPELAHDPSMRPRLLQILTLIDPNKNGRLDFRGFLMAMQLIRERQDQAKVIKEHEAITAVGLSQIQVKELRDLYSEQNGEGLTSISKIQIISMVCKVCHFPKSSIPEFSKAFLEVKERSRICDKASDDMDFPEFLFLMKKLHDADFGGIASLNQAKYGSR